MGITQGRQKLTRYHLDSCRKPAPQTTCNGIPRDILPVGLSGSETMFSSLPRAHSHLPGLSDRVSQPTLLFTAFENIGLIIPTFAYICQQEKEKLRNSIGRAIYESPAQTFPGGEGAPSSQTGGGRGMRAGMPGAEAEPGLLKMPDFRKSLQIRHRYCFARTPLPTSLCSATVSPGEGLCAGVLKCPHRKVRAFGDVAYAR